MANFVAIGNLGYINADKVVAVWNMPNGGVRVFFRISQGENEGKSEYVDLPGDVATNVVKLLNVTG